MSTSTKAPATTVAIPEHPNWCRAEVEDLLDFDKSCTGIHHGVPIYAEAQQFDVCISLGLIQHDRDTLFPETRSPDEPKIELGIRSRAFYEGIAADLDLSEARQLARVLKEAIQTLEMVHEQAAAAEQTDWCLSWALGWIPEALR
jgi:hypothetical protein